MTHELKVWPEFFEAIMSNDKPFEIRKDDRNFSVGDILLLREYIPENYYGDGKDAWYSNMKTTSEITYILQGGKFGVREGYVVMGLNRGEYHNIKTVDQEASQTTAFQDKCEHIRGSIVLVGNTAKSECKMWGVLY